MDNSVFLEHHGVKGMKWGVRRYQNSDGSLASAGRKRTGDAFTAQQKTEQNKKIARVGMSVATVAAAAYYVHKNPAKIGQIVSKFRGVKVSDISQKAVDAGKRYVKTCVRNSVTGDAGYFSL